MKHYLHIKIFLRAVLDGVEVRYFRSQKCWLPGMKSKLLRCPGLAGWVTLRGEGEVAGAAQVLGQLLVRAGHAVVVAEGEGPRQEAHQLVHLGLEVLAAAAPIRGQHCATLRQSQLT